MAQNSDKRQAGAGTAQQRGTGAAAAEEGYRLARLLRRGSRELERQYNTKKAKRIR